MALLAHGATVTAALLAGAAAFSSVRRASVTGEAEVRDVVAICRWAVDRLQASNIFLVGTSAGAPISGM